MSKQEMDEGEDLADEGGSGEWKEFGGREEAEEEEEDRDMMAGHEARTGREGGREKGAGKGSWHWHSWPPLGRTHCGKGIPSGIL